VLAKAAARHMRHDDDAVIGEFAEPDQRIDNPFVRVHLK
jgi:hypothetical protein